MHIPEMIDALLLFIQQNAEWSAGIVFVIAFLESMAIIGILVPGWLMLVGIGSLIGANVLPFYPIAIAAYLGAVSGEYLSYWLGYHFHKPILSWKFVTRHERMIEHSRHFFQRHGISGVFIGRFFGPTRAVVPFIAGVSEMPQVTFLWVNLLSGLLWAPLYLIPGLLVGAAVTVEENIGSYLLGNLLIITIGAAVCWNYGKALWIEWRHSDIKGLTMLKMFLALVILTLSIVTLTRTMSLPLLGQIYAILVSKLI